MRAERDSTTGRDAHAPALGVEERSDEAPRAGVGQASRAPRILEQRQRTLRLAGSQHPERFVHGTPKPQPLPEKVWINPPNPATSSSPAQ